MRATRFGVRSLALNFVHILFLVDTRHAT